MLKEDCYYEGYDSKGRLQRASRWLPLELLGCNSFYEAFRVSCSFLSQKSILEKMEYSLKIHSGMASWHKDDLYNFFEIYCKTIKFKGLYETIILNSYSGRERFRSIMNGEVEVLALSRLSHVELTSMTIFSDTAYVTEGVIFGSSVPSVHLNLGFVTGVDFSDCESVAELITNSNFNFKLYRNFRTAVGTRSSDLRIPAEVEIRFESALRSGSLIFEISGINSIRIKCAIKRDYADLIDCEVGFFFSNLNLGKLSQESYSKTVSFKI